MSQRKMCMMLLALCLALLVTSCKKSETTDPLPPAHTEQTGTETLPPRKDAPVGGEVPPDAAHATTASSTEAPEAPEAPETPETQETTIPPRPSLSEPGYLEEKYGSIGFLKMLQELTALADGGALPWLIDEYFVARELEFAQRENILRQYPWEHREEYGYSYSNGILALEDARVAGITNHLENNLGKIIDAHTCYRILSYEIEENGEIHVKAHDTTQLWYRQEGSTLLEESSFGRGHTLIIKATEDGLELIDDLYEEWDLTGVGTITPEPLRIPPQLTPSDPGYMEEKYEYAGAMEMLEKLMALSDSGALPWLLDEYFVARGQEFIQRENILQLHPWKQREEFGYLYSNGILDLENARVAGITNRIEQEWGRIVDVIAEYHIRSCAAEDNGDIRVEALESTWVWYQREGHAWLPAVGFIRDHTLIVRATEDGLELCEDLYDERDMTGVGTIPPPPGDL